MTTLTVEKNLRQSPDQVWRALQEPRLMRAWLPVDGRYRPIVGTRFGCRGPLGDAECVITEVQAARRLAFSWAGPAVDGGVVIELQATASGTRVTVRQSAQDDASHMPFVAFWHTSLGALPRALGGALTALITGVTVISAGLTTGLAVATGGLWANGHWDPPASPEPELAAIGTPPPRPSATHTAPSIRPTATVSADAPAPAPLPTAFDEDTAIVVVETQLPGTLHPLYVRPGPEVRTASLVFDRLTYRSPITAEMKSRVLARWEEVGPRLRATVNDTLVWHDGHPVDGQDVCFSLSAHAAAPVAGAPSIASCKADGSAVSVVFTQPFPDKRERLANVWLLPEHVLGTELGADHVLGTQPVGTGPYRAERTRDGVELLAVSSEVEISAIHIEHAEPSVAIERLLSGDADVVPDVRASLEDSVQASDTVALKSMMSNRLVYLELDPSVPPATRAALAQVDRDAVLHAVLGETASYFARLQNTTGPFPEASAQYNRAIQPPAAVVPASGAVKLAVRTDDTLQVRLAEALVQAWRAQGLDAELATVAPGAALPDDATAWLFERHHPVDVDPTWLRHTRTVPSQALLAELAAYSTATSDTTQQDAAHAIHARVAAELPIVPLFEQSSRAGVHNRIRGALLSPDTFWGEIREWKLR